jgi:hypothetical protein
MQGKYSSCPANGNCSCPSKLTFEFNYSKRRMLCERLNVDRQRPALTTRGELRAFDRLIFTMLDTSPHGALHPLDRICSRSGEFSSFQNEAPSALSEGWEKRGRPSHVGPRIRLEHSKRPTKRNYHAERGKEDERARDKTCPMTMGSGAGGALAN